MNWFDFGIIHFVNSFAHRSWVVDAIFVLMSTNPLLRSGVLMTMFWWAWIEHGKENIEKREILMIGLFATNFGVVVARVLADHLPFRVRPLHNPLLHFQLPYTMNPQALINWSSFPSDHAVLCFCMAACLWMVSRRVGAVAMCYAALVSLDRLYVGIHHPTDLLAGALLGIGIAFLCKVASLRTLAHTLLDYLGRRAGYLYCFLFLCTFEVGEVYTSVMSIGGLALRIALKYHWSRTDEVVGSVLSAGLLGFTAWLMWRKIHRVTEHAGRTVGHYAWH